MIEVGEKAPAFSLPDQDARHRKLSDYAGQWVVLYFYPRDNTPGCTNEACQFRDGREALAKRKVAVLGVSPDAPDRHRRFADKYGLNFTLLSDTGGEVCRKYGVWKKKINFGKTRMGVARTTYLIDPKGKVATRFDRVKVAGHFDAVLDELNRQRRSAAGA